MPFPPPGGWSPEELAAEPAAGDPEQKPAAAAPEGPSGAEPPFFPPPPGWTPTPAAERTDAQDDVFEQIRKLGALRDEGLLTEDEFQAKKVELLARL